MIVDFVGWYAPDHNVTTISDLPHNNNNVFHTATDWLIVIGEKEVVPVLEMGIRFMQLQQTCLLWCHSKYAYGMSYRKYDTSNDKLQPDSNVMYQVTVKKIISSQELERSSFKIRLCESKKNIANDIYKNELMLSDATQYSSKGRALNLYKRSAEMLEYMIQQANSKSENDDNLPPQEQEPVSNDFDMNFDVHYAQELFIDCLNNITAVHMICKEFHTAKQAAIDVLLRDPNNIKGLIRAAKISLLDPASTYEEVDESIKAVVAVVATTNNEQQHQLDPKILSDIEKLKIDFIRKKQQYNQRKKQISQNIAKGLQKTSNKITNVDDDSTTKSVISTTAQEPNSMFFEKIKTVIHKFPIGRITLLLFGFQLSLTILMYLYFKNSSPKATSPQGDQETQQDL